MRQSEVMFLGDSFLFIILFYVGIILISILVTWLVIYSAVRAALTSHRQAMIRDDWTGRV
ncbi:hypothetical protein AB0O87_03950 [Microbacterium sp. NPDC076768]|uniref:hypothetical protein n=1 Tax=Microbacterium sp. NPDC076768 TaxID=3154858 RepID=UPI003445E78F